VVRRCVWSRNLKNEEIHEPLWVAAPQKKNIFIVRWVATYGNTNQQIR
jgi:hypothetical protein